jgi:hypothetical protein
MLNKKITKEQQQAIKRKYDQDNQGLTYLQFRRTVQYSYGLFNASLVQYVVRY